MADHEKLVIIATHAGEDPERSTLPFVLGCAALASDVECVIAFQGAGITLLQKGVADHVYAPEFAPLKQLMHDFVDLGGKLLACSPCLKSRHLESPADLVDDAEVIAAGRLVAELASSTASLVY